MAKEIIGFLGLGVMGDAMARNLLKAGNEVIVYNRTREKAEGIVALGAVQAMSPREVGEKAKYVFSCVTNGATVRDLFFSEMGLVSGKTKAQYVCDFSTIAPLEVKEISSSLASHGVEFLDAPVTGGDVGARNATLTIMVGGSKESFAVLLPFLQAVGKKIIHVGESGKGQLTKCVNQIAVAVSIASMTEALAFATEVGLDLEQTLDIIRSGAAGSWALENYAPRLLRRDLKPGFHAKNMLKDIRIALSEAGVRGRSLPVTNLTKELFTSLTNISRTDEIGNHALMLLYEALDGRQKLV